MCLLSAALSFPLMSPALSGFPSEPSIALLKWADFRDAVKLGVKWKDGCYLPPS